MVLLESALWHFAAFLLTSAPIFFMGGMRGTRKQRRLNNGIDDAATEPRNAEELQNK